MAKILGGVKFQHFWALLRPTKCFEQVKKWGRPKIDENFGWGKTRTSLKLPNELETKRRARENIGDENGRREGEVSELHQGNKHWPGEKDDPRGSRESRREGAKREWD